MANSINKKLHTKMAILSLFFLLFPLVATSYNPDYNLAINCGYPTNTTSLDNRIWVGDDDIHDSNLFTFTEPKTTNPSLKLAPNSLSNTQIPFTTARASLSNFTYSFSSINTSPVFLRLHFYPTSYQNFEPSGAFFSVKVNNNLTLLQNFDLSLWHHNDYDETITKEYCIQIKPNENLLNITFIPNNINQSNVYYAFVNGIEVVSMPSFLYYTDLDDANYHLKFIDSDNTEFQIRNDKALEMIYRVNVGENRVPPNQDTGMFRNWDNDYPLYLEKEYPLSVSSDFGEHINYLKNTVPNYTAPDAVYLTARTYGRDVKENHNVTWNFEIDSTFTYMVRLHFCEFDYHIKNEGDRVFQIFIDDILAERRADVISWSGARLVPVYRDYAVTMYSKEGSSQMKRVNLSIKLQPENIYTKYRDVILNGIEILKISNKSYNLAGLNPEYLYPNIQLFPSLQYSKLSIIVIVVLVEVSFFLLEFVVVGIIVLVRRRRRFKFPWKKKKDRSSTLPSHLCRYFTIAEIRAATNNFDDDFIIGVGGFGNVYKGCIDGSKPVAIKRLKTGSQQGANEFMNEIELLSQLRHIHLVSLVGYCNDNTEMILLYEFMHRGTLSEYLYGSDNQPLPWKQRLEILLGAAKGIRYLHDEVKHKIIHRDIKSTNILLDEKWVAKVSDFGLSKVGPTGISKTHISTMVKGSLGYLDPEYYMFQRLTLKSDVYSFGVVLLEVLCARPPLVRDLDKKTANLVGWFQRCCDEGVAIEQLVDPFLRNSITKECLKYYCKLALSCLHDDGSQRPTMSQVVGGLEFMLQMVVSEEDNQFGSIQIEESNNEVPHFLRFISDEDSDLHLTKSYSYKESTVSARPSTQEHPFSVIGNLRARSLSCENLKIYI